MSEKKNQELRRAGLKITAPRLKILHILENTAAGHMSAEDIYKTLLSEGDDVGLATVYRVLSQFETAGLVVRHGFDENHAVYELETGDHHDHLVCQDCRKIIEFVDESIEVRQAEIARKHDFKMTSHCLYIYGICGSCQTDLPA